MNNNITNGLFAALLLASPLVGAEQKYPAADFQPEVVYQDNDYIAKSNKSIDNAETNKVVEADAKFPASSFQPTVVYIDNNYKHVESGSGSVAVASNSTEAADSVSESAAPASKKQESSNTYLFGLIAIAAVGFLLFRKQSSCPAKRVDNKSAEVVRTAGNGQLTGVARYLNKKSGTGVSRYLEKQVKSATTATGVARYLAKQVSTAKTTAATGVEKYMRNRG